MGTRLELRSAATPRLASWTIALLYRRPVFGAGCRSSGRTRRAQRIAGWLAAASFTPGLCLPVAVSLIP